jgi:hypothetical protein
MTYKVVLLWLSLCAQCGSHTEIGRSCADGDRWLVQAWGWTARSNLRPEEGPLCLCVWFPAPMPWSLAL